MNGVCKNCAAPLEPETKFCGACGSVVTALPVQDIAVLHPSSADGGRRYPALRIIALLLKIEAVLTAVVGVISGIGGVIAGLSATAITSSLPNYAGLSSPGISAAGSAIGWFIFLAGLCNALLFLCCALYLWAAAEMIHLLIDIEENTRRTLGAVLLLR